MKWSGATRLITGLALLAPTAVAAQSVDPLVLKEVADYPNYVARGNWQALLVAAATFLVLMVTLFALSRRPGRARPPWIEWLCMVLLPPLACAGVILFSADGSVAKAPDSYCTLLEDERPLSISDASQREQIERGLALCKVAEDGRLRFALEVGERPVVLSGTLALVLTAVIWGLTNLRVVRRGTS